MSETIEKAKKLVARLLEKTRAGELNWDERPGMGPDTSHFRIDLDCNGLLVSVGPGTLPSMPSVLRFYKTNSAGGKEIILDLREGLGPELEELFNEARRNARKAEQAIDILLEKLAD